MKINMVIVAKSPMAKKQPPLIQSLQCNNHHHRRRRPLHHRHHLVPIQRPAQWQVIRQLFVYQIGYSVIQHWKLYLTIEPTLKFASTKLTR